MKIEKQNFSSQEIHLDYNEFIGCAFTECTLIYHGYGVVSLVDCSFNNVKWTFSDAAANTLKFMAGLYHGAGEGGKQLIDQTFANIKANRVSGPPPA